MRAALAALLLLVATAASPATDGKDKGKDAFQDQSKDAFRLRGHLEGRKSPKHSMWRERGGFWGQARAMYVPRAMRLRRGVRDDDRDGIPNRFDTDDDNDGTIDDLEIDLSDY